MGKAAQEMPVKRPLFLSFGATKQPFLIQTAEPGFPGVYQAAFFLTLLEQWSEQNRVALETARPLRHRGMTVKAPGVRLFERETGISGGAHGRGKYWPRWG
jgi:hypothetical protein